MSGWGDFLLSYTDNNTDHTPVICDTSPTLYVNVPPEMIRAVIVKHIGLVINSGRLSPVIERNEEGCQWVTVTEPPSDISDSEEGETEWSSSSRMYGSPYSMIHMDGGPTTTSITTVNNRRSHTITTTDICIDFSDIKDS